MDWDSAGESHAALTFWNVHIVLVMKLMEAIRFPVGVLDLCVTSIAAVAAAFVWLAGLALLFAMATSLVVFGSVAWGARFAAGRVREIKLPTESTA